ncbi:MAG: hypothetical protein HYZ28_16700 [Myxococcales bacterium]|nr:hypothetical protein [Myxococcales bacterium]
MKRTFVLCLAAVGFASPAFAQEKAAAPAAPPAAPAAPAMDMGKMGPWARKPTNEKQTKKEIAEFFKAEEELGKKGDLDGMAARVDFPVYMATDDSKGTPLAKLYNREEYIAEMKPFFENMPKDMKMTHKPTVLVLSDSLVSVSDEYTMGAGKQKMSGKNGGLLVKRDNQWKWKMMVEAGWGDQPPAAAAAPGAPAPSAPPAKSTAAAKP